MNINLPSDVKRIISLIEENNHEAFVVGGCVRDSLMGITPHDWDICTNALPNEVQRIFSSFNTFDAGIKHGTVSVVLNDSVYEITTFRIDGEYCDNRHPQEVEFTSDIESDLARRDFTVNAIAYNEKCGIVDPFNGINDIKLKAIRCVGNPEERFNEDALRIMRALRFASTYDMSIEINTANSIIKCAHLLNNIASERISDELNKLVCGKNCEYILRRFREVFAVIIPEIAVMFGYDQHTKHHNKTLWRHTTCAMSLIDAEPLLRMTMLLHDIGKPLACKQDPDGTCHFKGHPKFSAAIAETILNRLKYPKDFIETCLILIKFHDVRFSDNKRQIKRVMNYIGKERMPLLMKVQYADMMSQSMYKREEKLFHFQQFSTAFDEIIENEECFSLKDLNINGHDLIRLGITDGKQIGATLKKLLDSVIDGKTENEKNALIERAKEINTDDKE